MTLTDKIYAVLSTDTGVLAQVPATRVKPYGSQQGLTLPYIVHGGSVDGTSRTHDALVKLKRWQYKVSCFAANMALAEYLAGAVVAVLGNYRAGGINSHFASQLPMPFEADVRVQQIVLTFDIWESL